MKRVNISEANNHLSELLKQSATDQAPILLIENDQTTGVLLNVKLFEVLMNAWQHKGRSLMPLNQLQANLQQSFAAAGYESREKIVGLIQQIKQEMAEERKQGSIGGDFVN